MSNLNIKNSFQTLEVYARNLENMAELLKENSSSIVEALEYDDTHIKDVNIHELGEGIAELEEVLQKFKNKYNNIKTSIKN